MVIPKQLQKDKYFEEKSEKEENVKPLLQSEKATNIQKNILVTQNNVKNNNFEKNNDIEANVKCNNCNSITTITTINKLPLLQLLQLLQSNKDIVLAYIRDYNILTNIAKDSNIHISTISNIIHNESRNTGLLDEGLVTYKDTKPKEYYLTDMGIEYLQNIFDMYNNKIQQQQEQKAHEQILIQEMENLTNMFKENYNQYIQERVTHNKRWVGFDFKQLMKINPLLCEKLLDEPEETIKRMEIAIEDGYSSKQIQVKLFNLPKTEKVKIGDIRCEHIGKLRYFEGVIKQTSQVKPKVTLCKYECPLCGAIHTLLQNEQKLLEPKGCGCGRKGKLTLLSKNMEDLQILKVEELPEELNGRTNCQNVTVLLRKSLAQTNLQQYYNPGSRIKINGVVYERPIIKNNIKDVIMDLHIEANYIEPQEKVSKLNISAEDKEKIKAIAERKDYMKLLINSFCPDLIDIDYQKIGVFLSLVKGGNTKRDEIHLLFAGEPGLGKSEILKRIPEYFYFGRYANGASSSSVGLTASVSKDEYTGAWSLNAGTVVMANGGIACIDEVDKMKDEDKNDLNECAEQGTVTINKAGISGSLQSRTTLIMASNPKHHQFDNNSSILAQLNLPYALITRFDLIFVLKNTNEQMLRRMELINNSDLGETLETIDKDLFVKYIIYAKEFNPKLTKESKENIMDRMRGIVAFKNTVDNNVPLTIRQLHAMRRLSTAFAKLRFSKYVEKQDVDNAWEIYSQSLRSANIGDSDELVVEEKAE